MGENAEEVAAEGRVSIPNGRLVSHRRVSAYANRRDSKALESMVRQEDSGMAFQRVCVDADGKRILWDVSGRAVPGQMLAVMGPSGEQEPHHSSR